MKRIAPLATTPAAGLAEESPAGMIKADVEFTFATLFGEGVRTISFPDVEEILLF